MKKSLIVISIFQLFLFIDTTDLYSQSWNFIKEKDGIKIYTRKEANSSLKSFKGEAYLHTQMEKVTSLIGNVKNFDWWDDDITEIKVLLNEKTSMSSIT